MNIKIISRSFKFEFNSKIMTLLFQLILTDKRVYQSSGRTLPAQCLCVCVCVCVCVSVCLCVGGVGVWVCVCVYT